MAGNRLDKEDPEPLYYFYRGYLDEGAPMPAAAREAVHYAAVLAPQDPEVQVRSSIQYLRDSKPADAKAQLASMAFSPHRNRAQRVAQEIYNLIDANKGAEAIALAEKELVKITEED